MAKISPASPANRPLAAKAARVPAAAGTGSRGERLIVRPAVGARLRRPRFRHEAQADQSDDPETEDDQIGQSERPTRPFRETAGDERADAQRADVDRCADGPGPDNRRTRIGAEAQFDQVGDRRPGGEPGRDAGEQASDEQDRQPLPRCKKSGRRHHDRHGTEHHTTAPHACRDAGLCQKRRDGARREDRIDHRDREGREVIPHFVDAVEGARKRYERHNDQEREGHHPKARPIRVCRGCRLSGRIRHEVGLFRGHGTHQTFMPPSTTRSIPVMYALSSETR